MNYHYCHLAWERRHRTQAVLSRFRVLYHNATRNRRDRAHDRMEIGEERKQGRRCIEWEVLFADSRYWERRSRESQEFHLAGSVTGWGVRERQVGSRRMECTFGNSRLFKVLWGSCVGS